jgi:Uma2 family endonuclease
MSAVRKPERMTFEDYLDFEDATALRHELMDGNVFAMSGASDVHNLICTNLMLLIAGPLLGKCQVFQGGMKLKVDHANSSDGFYPDVMVSCSATDRDKLFRKEPVLLIEVLSPSTARIDRGANPLADRIRHGRAGHPQGRCYPPAHLLGT